jgi:hypothetical protein
MLTIPEALSRKQEREGRMILLKQEISTRVVKRSREQAQVCKGFKEPCLDIPVDLMTLEELGRERREKIEERIGVWEEGRVNIWKRIEGRRTWEKRRAQGRPQYEFPRLSSIDVFFFFLFFFFGNRESRYVGYQWAVSHGKGARYP